MMEARRSAASLDGSASLSLKIDSITEISVLVVSMPANAHLRKKIRKKKPSAPLFFPRLPIVDN